MTITIKQVLLIILIILTFWSSWPHWINFYENGTFLSKPLPNQNHCLFVLSCFAAIITLGIIITLIVTLIGLLCTSDFLNKEFKINFKFNKLFK